MNNVEQAYQKIENTNLGMIEGQKFSNKVINTLSPEERSELMNRFHDDAIWENERIKKLENIKNITILRDEYEGASNGGGGEKVYCVDGKLHVTNATSWYDQSGDEENSFSHSTWSFSECDCGKAEISPGIPAAVVEAIDGFIKTGEMPSDIVNDEGEDKRDFWEDNIEEIMALFAEKK